MLFNNDINNSVQQELTEWLTDQKDNLGLGTVSNTEFQQILQDVLPDLVNSYAQDVQNFTNDSLNNGPSEALGTVNNFNIATGNQDASTVSGSVINRLGTKGALNLQNKVVAGVVNGLQAKMASRSGINYDVIGVALNNLISPLFGKLTNKVSTNFVQGIFNNEFESDSFINTQQLNFGNVTDPEVALEPIDIDYVKNATKVFLDESKNFNIQDPENIKKLSNVKRGFVDPTATYPTNDYANTSEVNKLAKGDPVNSLVQSKDRNRVTAAPLPNNSNFSEPPSAYKAEYPYNKVTETESGHIIEIDDTPGSERLHVYHKSGTYIEIDRDGNMVCRRKGSDYQIIDRNGYVSVAGHLNLSVAGSVNLYSGNSSNVEIIGDAKVIVHNDAIIQSGGNVNISSADTLSLRGKHVRIEADENFDMVSDELLRIKSNDIDLVANVDYKAKASNIHVKSTGSVYYEATKTIHTTAKDNKELYSGSHELKAADIKVESSGSMKTKASNMSSSSSGGGINMDNTSISIRGVAAIDMDALFITQQEGQAESLGNMSFSSLSAPEKPTEPELAKNSYAGILSGRRDFVAIDMQDSIAMCIADKFAIESEEESDNEETRKNLVDKLKSRGLVSEDQINQKATEQGDVLQVSTSNRQIITPSEFCLGLTEAPDNFKLSPNFTLAHLSSKAACSNIKIQAQLGLTYGQILTNLQALALNICEPVFNLYPNMYITSGFRLSSSNQTSQHPRGQAVDIQFKGAAPGEYFKIANLLARSLNYDQLLLEYSSYTNNPWIHISFSYNSKNRNQILTFWNNKVHTSGLVQLA